MKCQWCLVEDVPEDAFCVDMPYSPRSNMSGYMLVCDNCEKRDSAIWDVRSQIARWRKAIVNGR